ncbi:restriction endonuclease subunit S [Desulfovibrio sp. OttesenSCG-928-A18]|nr:restriction endonuclease subunit S [Desulfovibrio sp. OttesenSCG-928-A18]
MSCFTSRLGHDIIQDVPQKAVASMHFFRVRAKQGFDVVPEFLAWQLEQAPAQRYYSSKEAGSAQKSLRLVDFAETPIVLPPLDRQHMLMQAVRSFQTSIETMKACIANSENLLAAIAVKEF